MQKCFFFFLVTLFRFGVSSSVAYLALANLSRLGITIQCQVSVRSKYIVRFLSLCWITGGHKIHPPIEGMLPHLVLNSHRSEFQAPNQLYYQRHTQDPAKHVWQRFFRNICQHLVVNNFSKNALSKMSHIVLKSICNQS